MSADEFLGASIVVMDGGMGRELMRLGVPEDKTIWSARALVDEKFHPKVVEVHKLFIAAGAQTITTNNYGVQPGYYRRAFPDSWEERIKVDTAIAVRLAVEAKQDHPKVKVLGCLPPICESHRSDLTSQFLEEEGTTSATSFYRTIGQALVEGGAEVLLAETMNTWEEAAIAVKAVAGLGLPIFLSMQGSLRDPEQHTARPWMAADLAKKVLELRVSAPIQAFGFNCAPPEDIINCLKTLVNAGLDVSLRAAGVALMAYGNVTNPAAQVGYRLGLQKSFPGRRTDVGAQEFCAFCKQFANLGCTYIGGCCGTRPDDIRAIHETFTVEAEESTSKVNVIG